MPRWPDICRVVAYEDRQGGFIFVRVPNEYGRYVRTSRVVAMADCPACGSLFGVPCVGQYDRYTGSIHADRMREADRNCSFAGVRRSDILTPDILSKTGLWNWL